MEHRTEAHLLARAARAQADGRLPSLVAAVVRDGGLAWSAGRGRVGAQLPDSDTQYRIGSITKTLTAVLVMRLRDEGLLRLDDTVDRHVPELSLPARTVGQLLSHSAGLSAEPAGSWWERSPGRDWPDLAAGIVADALPLGAGRRFHYSNLGYAVLGRIVERLRGSTWMDCLRTEVLAPLEMRRTTAAAEAPAARGFAVHPWADVALEEPAHETAAMGPAGELWSTAGDLARLAAFLLGDTAGVLATTTVEEMRIPAGVDDSADPWSGYGLGLQVLRPDGRVLYGHGGSMPGFRAGLLVDPAERTASVVLANATSGLDGSLAVDLLRTVRDHEPTVVPEWRLAGTRAAGLVPILGTWYWGPSPYLLSLRGDDVLDLRAIGPGRGSVFRQAADGAWVGEGGYFAGERLQVVRAEDGSVSHLDVATFVFTRAPYEPGSVVPGGVPDPAWRGMSDS